MRYLDTDPDDKWRIYKHNGLWWSWNTYSPMSSLRAHLWWQDAIAYICKEPYFWNEDYSALVGGPR